MQASAQTQSAERNHHRRLCARMDRPKAITVTAHNLARLVHFMLSQPHGYLEGRRKACKQEHLGEVVQNLNKRAREVGLELFPTVTLTPWTANIPPCRAR